MIGPSTVLAGDLRRLSVDCTVAIHAIGRVQGWGELAPSVAARALDLADQLDREHHSDATVAKSVTEMRTGAELINRLEGDSVFERSDDESEVLRTALRIISNGIDRAIVPSPSEKICDAMDCLSSRVERLCRVVETLSEDLKTRQDNPPGVSQNEVQNRFHNPPPRQHQGPAW